MGQQLRIPMFPEDTFAKVRAAYAWQELQDLKQQLKKANNSLRTYKGHHTKRNKKKS